MTTYITFHGGNGGAGGVGGASGGPASPAFGSSTNAGSGQNSQQGNAGSGTTNPEQPMLPIRREQVDIDVGHVSSPGYVTTVTVTPTTLPRRLVLTANCNHLACFQIATGARVQVTKAQPSNCTMGCLGTHQNTITRSDYDPHTMPDSLGRSLRKVRRITSGIIFCICSASAQHDRTSFSMILSNIFNIDIAPQPNQHMRFTFYLARPGPVTIEVTTSSAPSTSSPAPTYRSQGITVDFGELLPPDLAAWLYETEPETNEEPKLITPELLDLKRKQETEKQHEVTTGSALSTSAQAPTYCSQGIAGHEVDSPIVLYGELFRCRRVGGYDLVGCCKVRPMADLGTSNPERPRTRI
ncbi:hypothetical protein BC827DRAFT_1303911 [Russula dissimulans]|nr:hypothetical protein BC827DRAFT_1303911 [Russula dissimulans]